MKIHFRSPAFPQGTPSASTSIRPVTEPGASGQYSVLVRVPRKAGTVGLRVYLEQAGATDELVRKGTLPQNRDILVGAIASALALPDETIWMMSADERRIVGLLILESGRHVPTHDIALALSGSFRGLTTEFVSAAVTSINELLTRNKSRILVGGGVEEGFTLTLI